MNNLTLPILALLSGVAMAETQINEDTFHVKLPENWTLIDRSEEEGLWIYQSATGDERLTVSIKYFTIEPSFSEIKDSITAYVDIRKEASSDMHPSISVSPDVFKEFPTAFTNTFIEKGPEHRKAANKTIATRIGIANFYYESYEDNKTFMDNMKSIFSTTGFAS